MEEDKSVSDCQRSSWMVKSKCVRMETADMSEKVVLKQSQQMTRDS